MLIRYRGEGRMRKREEHKEEARGRTEGGMWRTEGGMWRTEGEIGRT